MTWIIHFTSVFISLSSSRSLYCTWCDGSSQLQTFSWSKKKKKRKMTVFFWGWNPMPFFSFSQAATRLGNSMSAHPTETCFLANKFYTQNLFAVNRKLRFWLHSATELRNQKVGMALLSGWNQKTNTDLRPACYNSATVPVILQRLTGWQYKLLL